MNGEHFRNIIMVANEDRIALNVAQTTLHQDTTNHQLQQEEKRVIKNSEVHPIWKKLSFSKGVSQIELS